MLVNCQVGTTTRFPCILSQQHWPRQSFPSSLQQTLLWLHRSQDVLPGSGWDAHVPSSWNCQIPHWFWDGAWGEPVLAQLLPCSTGWFVFPPFLFFEYRCCCLYFRYWYIIDQSTENAQITLELRFYGGEELTAVRGWLVSILILRHSGCFHWHHLKMLPVPIYLRNDLCLKLIISQLFIFFSLMFLLEAVFLHSG